MLFDFTQCVTRKLAFLLYVWLNLFALGNFMSLSVREISRVYIAPILSIYIQKLYMHISIVLKDKRRRSSWQAKVDRRRRKGMSSSSAQVIDDDKLELPSRVSSGYLLQKRNSWWNIFVPDNLKQRWLIFINFYFFIIISLFWYVYMPKILLNICIWFRNILHFVWMLCICNIRFDYWFFS